MKIRAVEDPCKTGSLAFNVEGSFWADHGVVARKYVGPMRLSEKR